MPVIVNSWMVERLTARLASRPRWVGKLALGLTPAGVAAIVQTLWNTLDGERKVFETGLAAAKDRIRHLECKQKSVAFYVDRAIDQFGRGGSAGILLMTPGDFALLAENEYNCTVKSPRTMDGARWAWSYRGFPVWTAKGIGGPFVLTRANFEGLRLSIGKNLSLREM